MVVAAETISRTLSITIYFRCACSVLAVESIKDSHLYLPAGTYLTYSVMTLMT